MADWQLERDVWAKGKGDECIAGIDEAGRGPLAGPVSAAAVILPKNYECDGLTDSKKLSEKKRETIYEQLVNDSDVYWAQIMVDAREIEAVNILRATHLAMERAVGALKKRPDLCLIDGLPVPGFPYESQAIVKGDARSVSIAAASIIAKVTRDRFMVEADGRFPEYGFARHKGYGTKAHLEAIAKHGPCELHRMTFRPISQLTFL